MESSQLPVVIVGGGLAGMRCAQNLAAAGLTVALLESQDRLGGRVRTDEIDGFRLDRGFQVLLTEYPEARKTFDYAALDLQTFDPGALIRVGGRFVRISDPMRSPLHALATARAPIGGLRDKMRILAMKTRLTRLTTAELLERPERTAMDALANRWGFSEEAIQRFFKPFFGGIFLDDSLRGSSRMMEYVFQLFSRGHAALPAGGMGRLADQLARGMGNVDTRLNATVRSVDRNLVILDDGTHVSARAVVVAADGPESNRLLGASDSPDYVGTHCHYFAADSAPRREPVLILNGEGTGPVNNVAILTNVAPSYSATSEALISVTVLDRQAYVADDESLTAVRDQLCEWFGTEAQHWRHVKTYHIPTALPDQSPPFLAHVEKPVRVDSGLYRCGDYLDTASINGALRSGRRAAEAVIADL